MKIDLRESDGVAILDLSGRLTTGVGDEMLREAVDALVGSGRTRILLNLSGLEFMDSAGLGELVASLRLVERFGGKLKITNAPQRVASSLSLSRLLPVFEIFDDEKKAVASFVTAESG
jgi:anti-sigma B factor antagonist